MTNEQSNEEARQIHNDVMRDAGRPYPTEQKADIEQEIKKIWLKWEAAKTGEEEMAIMVEWASNYTESLKQKDEEIVETNRLLDNKINELDKKEEDIERFQNHLDILQNIADELSIKVIAQQGQITQLTKERDELRAHIESIKNSYFIDIDYTTELLNDIGNKFKEISSLKAQLSVSYSKEDIEEAGKQFIMFPFFMDKFNQVINSLTNLKQGGK